MFRRVPQTTIAIAAATLTTAKNPFASPFRDPPSPNSAPWFTRGMTGALHVWREEKPQSQVGVSWSNCAISLNHPGTTSLSLPTPCVNSPPLYSHLNTPYLLTWSALSPITASVTSSQR